MVKDTVSIDVACRMEKRERERKRKYGKKMEKNKNREIPDLRHRSYVLSPRCTARSKLPHSNSESNVRECAKGSPSPSSEGLS